MKRQLPGIGMRMVKSAVAVAICLLLSLLFNREGMRIYSSIAAMWCIRPYTGDTRKMARQRIAGTAIGSVFGAVTIALEVYLLDINGTPQGYLLEAAFILAVLWTTVALHMDNASYFSCVVYLSIAVAHITDANPWVFVWLRAAETLIGIAVGMAVNAFHLPRRRVQDTLFVSGVDDVLLDSTEELTPYSRVQLNRMLDDGALFTISTMRTPASVREVLGGIRFRLPIIVMDGAAMYDLKEKRFLHACILPKDLTLSCCDVLERCGIHCFINGILNDNLMIYYGALKNDAEKDIYDKMHTSPYRNYVEKKYYNQCAVIYLMAIDRTEVLRGAVEELERTGLASQVKLRFYLSTNYPGYSYLKIYEKSASRQTMLETLKREVGVEKSVIVGSVAGQADVVVHTDSNHVVRQLEQMYEPLIWQKER
jgi:hydroxymethylpyrimidine pyrophosphatase-like HAD family hydrolase